MRDLGDRHRSRDKEQDSQTVAQFYPVLPGSHRSDAGQSSIVEIEAGLGVSFPALSGPVVLGAHEPLRLECQRQGPRSVIRARPFSVQPTPMGQKSRTAREIKFLEPCIL